jgi:GDPmannose 4,6-dehydratase
MIRNNMKAVIFGITGQDGSHLADLLLEKGYKVVGVARRSSVDNTQRVKHLLGVDGFELVSGDITDCHSITSILRENDDVNEVYNLAAQSHVAVSFKQPGLTWDATAKGCMNILQSLVDLGMISTRFYQASSSEMFGKEFDTMEVPVDLVAPFDGPSSEILKYQNEDTKFLPQSPYAIAKCAAHYMTRLYREGYGLHASAGILFNHEGPRRGEDFVTRKITKWIGEFVRWVDGKENIITGDQDSIQSLDPIDRFPKLRLGNLEAFRDWGYAGDYVEAMWMMLQQDSPDDYVICTGKTHTIRKFLDVAFSHVGIKDWSEYVVQDPEFYRPAEVDYLRGDNQKAKSVLGWEPKHSFEDLVKMMVESDTDDVK